MSDHFKLALTEQESMPILRAPPEKPGPLVLIIPSIFGIGPDVVDYADCFAHAGALVYVLDSFWRTDPGPLAIPSGAARAMKRMQAADHDAVLRDVLCALDAGMADDLCNGSVILLGICFGGQFAVKAASIRPVQGLATWHGGKLLSILGESGLEHVHVEMDFGEIDPLIPLSDVLKIKHLLQHHVNCRIRTHKHSAHGFTHTGTVKYNAKAAKQARDGVLKLIETFC